MRNRLVSAHLLRDWDSEDGIAHASALPPTKISLASEERNTRKMRSRQVVEEKPAIALICFALLCFDERELCFERELREVVVQLALSFVMNLY